MKSAIGNIIQIALNLQITLDLNLFKLNIDYFLLCLTQRGLMLGHFDMSTLIFNLNKIYYIY